MINIKYLILVAVMANMSVALFIGSALGLEVSSPPTLKQVIDVTHEYNLSVDDNQKITLNFNVSANPILSEHKTLGGAVEIEQFVRNTHQYEDKKEKEEQYNCGIVHPNCKSTVEMNEDNGRSGSDNDEEDNDNDEWTQKDFDDKYGNSLPDDEELSSD